MTSIYLRFILILLSHLRLDLPRDLFSVGLRVKIVKTAELHPRRSDSQQGRNFRYLPGNGIRRDGRAQL